MQKILLISGCKQSGKTSAMNYLAGYLLVQSGLVINNRAVSMFQLDEKGNLEFDYYFKNPETGEELGEWIRLDISQQDPEFAVGAERLIWPVIKPQSFADLIKEICVVVFGLSREEVYGTDEQKNMPSPIKRENMYNLFPALRPKKAKKKKGEEDAVEVQESEYLTNREFMQLFGTDICRGLLNECWMQAALTRIVSENYDFVVVPDCRFKDELDYTRQIAGVDVKAVRLTRNPFPSEHSSETDFDNYDGFDFVINNENMTQEEKGVELINYLRSIGWIS